MKTITIFLIALTIPFATLSQSCLPEGITFTTQSQIDSFAINYPGCTMIEGDLIIAGDSSVTNLDGLIMLTAIGERLSIGHHNLITNEIEGCPNLTDLSGLSNLDSIGLAMIILGNPKLKNFAGMENLKTISFVLYVEENDSLINFEGLQGLTTLYELRILENKSLLNLQGLENINYIAGNMTIGIDDFFQWSHGNPSLVNLEGLNNLDSIGGDAQIYLNNSLITLSGLENLYSIGGSLEIFGNRSLKNLSSLQGLSIIDSNLIIRINDSLQNLNGMQNIQNIGGYLEIGDNQSLISLEELINLTPSVFEFLWIHDNPLLSTCEATSICDYLAIPTNLSDVSDNATGCNSREEILEACSSGTSDEFKEGLLKIYPNPASEVLHISSSEKIESISIYNSRGEEVKRRLGDGGKRGRGEEETLSMSVSDLAPGLYLVKIATESQVINRRIIVIK